MSCLKLLTMMEWCPQTSVAKTDLSVYTLLLLGILPQGCEKVMITWNYFFMRDFLDFFFQIDCLAIFLFIYCMCGCGGGECMFVLMHVCSSVDSLLNGEGRHKRTQTAVGSFLLTGK